MKKLFHVMLALAFSVPAAFAQEEDLGKRVGGLQAQVDRVLSKAGIHFNGEFRSQFLNSQIEGDALQEATKGSESVEYTSVDFDVVARPNNALSARAVFRLHQDWRNFFSDVQNPITTRWLSIDGAVGGGILSYHAGDYMKKLSPLTLWNHEFELLYEPEIFASARRFAMAEAYVGDSKRLLQGADLVFKAELYPILSEVSADIFGARLATRGTIESGILPIDVSSAYDKYLLGFNLGSQIIKGAGFAVSDVLIYDYLASNLSGTEEGAKEGDPQSTNVLSFRLNADTRAFMDDAVFNAGISAEAALSADKHWKRRYTTETVTDDDGVSSEVTAPVPGLDGLEDTTVSGMAINAGLFAKVALGEGNTIKLTATYVMNNETFMNDAVQTPHFMPRQIMNSENNLSGLGILNPFDALYRTVFKYAPSQYFGQGGPYGKYAYTSAILPDDVRRKIIADSKFNLPSVFQAAGNSASADRVGPIVKLDGSFLDNAITVGARVHMVTTIDEKEIPYPIYDAGFHIGDDTVNVGKPEYMNAGGGASVDVAKFVPIVGPSLKIGGSFMMYNSKTPQIIGVDVPSMTRESASQLMSAELNYRFTERFSFQAGYQQLTTNIYEVNMQDVNYKFDNLGVGLGYKVADGGELILKLTRVSGEYKSKVIDEDGVWQDFSRNYNALQPEVWLTVKF